MHTALKPRRGRTVTDELMTTEEVASFLRVPKATLYAWRHAGRGPIALRVGRHLRFRRRDVERWLNEQQSNGAVSA